MKFKLRDVKEPEEEPIRTAWLQTNGKCVDLYLDTPRGDWVLILSLDENGIYRFGGLDGIGLRTEYGRIYDRSDG